MNSFFSADFSGEPFVMFSTLHIITLLVLALLNAILLTSLKRINSRRVNNYSRRILAGILMAFELLYEAWSLLAGVWSPKYHLPLQLCDLSLILSSVMLLNRSYFIYEVTFFLGLGGAAQALLTPGLAPYSFPHMMYFIFFTTHGGIVTAVLYMTLIEGYRPQLNSMIKAFVFCNIYMAFIAVVNSITGGNYLFICAKPGTASLLDFLSPWPWYVAELEALGVIIFFILYLPFLLKDMAGSRSTAFPYKSVGK
ncbi:MAG: TIGR02206 family membrane protein [Clostridiales bacterium]|jgi:hypothetical integral membrane protein (TIGR02206 family)|nr:TIGR02206 family membrane protein [Eubacteriales bacterium]MDH7566669.1 TIGR02206 family membrane protein [Clostridiales bacterium]